MRIDGRVFIVTGASSGIGLATARALGERGGKIALVARGKKALEDLAEKVVQLLAHSGSQVLDAHLNCAPEPSAEHEFGLERP